MILRLKENRLAAIRIAILECIGPPADSRVRGLRLD